jgi:hypothetical protein
VSEDPLVRGVDPVAPPEVREELVEFSKTGENGQVILNVSEGFVASYKTIRYIRVIDKKPHRKRKSA